MIILILLVHTITVENFVNYWKEVIEDVKQGEVEKLRLMLQREKNKRKKR